jgi:lipoprotein
MKKIITYILALLVGCSMLAASMTEARADDGISATSRGEDGEFTDAEVQELEQNLTILFSQVVIRDAEGKLRIDYEAAKRLYPDRDLSVLFEAAKGSSVPSDSSEAEGAQEYASCVIKGAIPFIGLLDIDWKLLRAWVTQQNWGALSRYLGREIPKRAAKIGLKEVFNLSPTGIALKLAASAITCAFWQQW